MEEGRKSASFFTDMLNKTKRDKIFIVILAGVLMMVIAMPTKSSSTKTVTTGSIYSDSSGDYDQTLGKELEEMLGNIEGVGEVKVLLKTSDERDRKSTRLNSSHP